jgi:hypothetical protein
MFAKIKEETSASRPTTMTGTRSKLEQGRTNEPPLDPA